MAAAEALRRQLDASKAAATEHRATLQACGLRCATLAGEVGQLRRQLQGLGRAHQAAAHAAAVRVRVLIQPFMGGMDDVAASASQGDGAVALEAALCQLEGVLADVHRCHFLHSYCCMHAPRQVREGLSEVACTGMQQYFELRALQEDHPSHLSDNLRRPN